MNRSKQRSLHRLMGSRHEMARQPDKHPLEALVERVDPHEDDREKFEMDFWEGNAPIEVVQNEDGEYVERTATTARGPKGDEDHAQNGKAIFTELIPRTDDE